ncbi:MAG: hypothetical protein JXR63_12785 [Spirochaetales bacterium]|nr:hypothetical protein [Spirochaetales bacterium]
MKNDVRDELYDPESPRFKIYTEANRSNFEKKIDARASKFKRKRRNRFILIDLLLIFFVGIFSYVIYPKQKSKDSVEDVFFTISSFHREVKEGGLLNIDNQTLFSAVDYGPAIVCSVEVLANREFYNGFKIVNFEFYNSNIDEKYSFDVILISSSYETFLFYLPFDGENDIINLKIVGLERELKLLSVPEKND